MSNELIIKEKRHIFELLGFETTNELTEFLGHTRNGYQKLLEDNLSYQDIVNQVLVKIGNSLKIDRERILQNSLYLASYDPMKENRERNMHLIKEGLKLGGDFAITILTGPVGDVAIRTAYAFSQNLLVDEKDRNAKEIFQTSFEKLLCSKGIKKDEAINIIDQGESLKKTIYK